MNGQCPFIFVFNNVEIMLIFMGLSPSATVRSATVSADGPQGSNTGLLGLCPVGRILKGGYWYFFPTGHNIQCDLQNDPQFTFTVVFGSISVTISSLL